MERCHRCDELFYLVELYEVDDGWDEDAVYCRECCIHYDKYREE